MEFDAKIVDDGDDIVAQNHSFLHHPGRNVIRRMWRHIFFLESVDKLNLEAVELRKIIKKQPKKPKVILDYWVWDHNNFPGVMYIFTRGFWISWTIDMAWEIVELLAYTLFGYAKGYDMDKPDEWPDAFRPETAFNSIINDMLNGLSGILYAKLFCWATDAAAMRMGWVPYEHYSSELPIQLLILACSGAMSGSGFFRLYFFSAIEIMLFFVISYFWNSNHMGLHQILLWMGVMTYTMVWTSMSRFIWPHEPIMMLLLGLSFLTVITTCLGFAAM